MYIVTGGAGFVGSNLLRALNERGESSILVVDRLGENFRNLTGCQFSDYMDRDEFLAALDRNALPRPITAIFHQGACTDTTVSDGRFMMENNFTFSRRLLRFALDSLTPLVYASSAAVYGAGTKFREEPGNEVPLNVYGLSKLAFDMHVRKMTERAQSTVVGLRYYNVYGPHEAHKGKMSSMPYQLHRQLESAGCARLFEGTGGYADGEQRRDFVFAGDVVKVNLFFAAGPTRHGIFNVGSGASRSFNDVARGLIGLRGKGKIEYIPFNQALKGKYQEFTEADLTLLRTAGYEQDFASLEEGLAKSVAAWCSEPAL